MKEARIILPVTDNDGKRLDAAHKWLVSEILDRFGGITAGSVTGTWKAPDGQIFHDECISYDIACEGSSDDVASLTTFAALAGAMARQLSVYIRLPSGEVQILETTPSQA